jgi:hypothetical protein
LQQTDVVSVGAWINGLAGGMPITAVASLVITLLIGVSLVFNAERLRQANLAAWSELEQLQVTMSDPACSAKKIREELLKIRRKYARAAKNKTSA